MIYIDQLESYNVGEASFKTPMQQISRVLKEVRFDIVHVHNLMPLLLLSLMKDIIRCPIVFTFYNTPNQKERAIGYFEEPELDLALARNIVESSQYSIAIATSKCYYDFGLRLGMPEDKVSLCYLGIELNEFVATSTISTSKLRKYFGTQIVDGDLVILLPGRIVKRKGVLETIKALAIVNESIDAKLILTGMALPFDQQFGEEVLAQIKKYGMESKVVVPVTTIPRTDLSTVYARADIVVTPSYYEGLGMTAVEALQSSRPLVATSVSGLNEVAINNVNAITVPPYDADSIAQAIIKLVKNPELASKLASNGPSSVKKFDIQEHVKGVESIYKDVLKRKK